MSDGADTITIRNVLLLLLACVAGSVDVFSYVGFGQVFTANMTGNTVLLGLALGQIETHAITRSGLALFGFMVGVVLGAWIVGRKMHDDVWMPRITVALAVEALILVGVLIIWQLTGISSDSLIRLALIVLTAASMGIQSAAVHDLSVSGVATTFITGTLTTFGVRSVEYMRKGKAPSPSRRTGEVPLSFAIWGSYLVSAMGTAAVIRLIHGLTLGVSIMLILVVVGTASLKFGALPS